jgi:hypothetical protein
MGSMCYTNNCSYRDTCQVRRLSLQIYTQNAKVEKSIALDTENGIFCISVSIISFIPDTYLNEGIGMVTSDRAAFNHAKK